MTNKDVWLKILSTNDTALASVIILAERFAKDDLSQREQTHIGNKVNWLYEEASNDLQNSFAKISS